MSQPNESQATPEQRERAVRYWEEVVRPQIARREPEKVQPTETPQQRLDRHLPRANEPVTIGAELAEKLAWLRVEIAKEAAKKKVAA